MGSPPFSGGLAPGAEVLHLDRSRRAGRFLAWKVRIFAAGAVLALAGIYLDDRWLTGGALVILLSGLVLRFLPGGRKTHGDGGDEEGPEPP
jgi:hypothetical protein